MPKADFTITLTFEGMEVGPDQDADYLASNLRVTARDTARGAMCEEWRDAFTDTSVVVSEIREDTWDTYTVALSVNLVGRVRVQQNGGDEYDRVREWADQIETRHIIPAGSVHIWGTEFTPDDQVFELNVEHDGPWDENTSILAVSS